ncbi:MAG: DNA polymerase IV [bacterium]|nr:DNA polymerase IV [bacterium]MCK6562281.1 hypothetical protein [bacterium]NUM65190.1 hypothetical protein [candidate division KSB1 bacterium]
MDRTILHINIPNFAVALECVRFPRLHGRPVAVAALGGERARLASVSPAAGAAGIVAGMPVYRARRLCRDLTVLPLDESYYSSGNARLAAILLNFSPVVEPYRFGRAHSDVTHTARTAGRAVDMGWQTLKEIHAQLRLAGTAGVGANKLLSRISSQVAPANAVQAIRRGHEQKFLAPLWSNYLPAVTATVWQELQELNLLRIGEIARFAAPDLVMVFGKLGGVLFEQAHGIDDTPVVSPDSARATEIIHGAVLAPDANDAALLQTQLLPLVERASEELRLKKCNTGKLRMEITFSDGKKAMGQTPLRSPAFLAQALYPAARELLYRLTRRRVRVRTIILALGKLSPQARQLDLFSPPTPARAEKLQLAMAAVRARCGEKAVGYVRVN